MKKILEKPITPKPIVSTKFCLLLALLVMCIVLFIMWTEQQLHRARTAPPPSPTQQISIAPSLETGGCTYDEQNNCVQTLLVSQYGKIETITGAEDAHTSLKLTNTKGEAYVFSDSEHPFISYEQAAFNNTKSEQGVNAGYYLVSAANRGKDGSYTFDKIYEVWLGDKLEVKNIINEMGLAGADFLQSGNQITYFTGIPQHDIQLVTYNLSEHAVEAKDNFVDALLKTNLSWYKKNPEKYTLTSVTTVPLGYVLSFYEDESDKGAVAKMVFWEEKAERLVLLK